MCPPSKMQSLLFVLALALMSASGAMGQGGGGAAERNIEPTPVGQTVFMCMFIWWLAGHIGFIFLWLGAGTRKMLADFASEGTVTEGRVVGRRISWMRDATGGKNNYFVTVAFCVDDGADDGSWMKVWPQCML